MRLLDIIVVALGLGMDALSVCMGIGVRWHGRRQQFRMAWHMGLFQFLMPVLGWTMGRQLATLLSTVGKYLAAGLVVAVGAKMLYEAIRQHPGDMVGKAEHKRRQSAPVVKVSARAFGTGRRIPIARSIYEASLRHG